MPSLWIAGSDGRLMPLEAEDYSRERDFQAMLADNPMLLASALDAGETSVAEWLLIDRELPILSDEDEHQTRWQLDHLFIDAQARPTLVEVKRSSDPRARREVVAQMLDYAASFGPDWSAERLRTRFSGRQRTGAAPAADAELESFLESTAFEDAQDFWREVDTNIDAGNIRLLFVADRLAPRLVNIIEYLNGQLQNAEVLGLEVLRHVDQVSGFEAYQPVVQGRSTQRARKKSTGERQTREVFEAILRANHGDEVVGAVDTLVGWAEASGAFVTIGTDPKSPRLFLNFHTAGSGRTYWPLAINPRPGKVALFLQYLKHHPAFVDDDRRLEFVEKMSAATGFAIDARLGGRPGFPVDRLLQPDVLDAVEDVLRWVTETADAVGG